MIPPFDANGDLSIHFIRLEVCGFDRVYRANHT